MLQLRNQLRIATRMLSSSSSTLSRDEVLFDYKNNVGIITLNRPRVLNSLNEGMVKVIYAKLKEWENKCSFVVVKGAGDKAFCAGGDVVAATRDKNAGLSFFRNEYKMNYLIGMYRRPYISICDGVTMGGGVGISVHGPYRIATERTLFAMPETQIGLFPDVGGSYFLPKLSGGLGMFLGLSGYRLQGVDVVKAGIATHFLPSSKLPAFLDKLVNVDPDCLGEFLSSATVDVSKIPFSLTSNLDVIDSVFYADSVEEIYHLLWRDGGMFPREIASFMKCQSPTSLKITYKELKYGERMNLRDCLKMEYRLAVAALEAKASPDFYEGVRALLIDKDKNPKWNPTDLEDVSNEMVERCFEKLPDSEELDI